MPTKLQNRLTSSVSELSVVKKYKAKMLFGEEVVDKDHGSTRNLLDGFVKKLKPIIIFSTCDAHYLTYYILSKPVLFK